MLIDHGIHIEGNNREMLVVLSTCDGAHSPEEGYFLHCSTTIARFSKICLVAFGPLV